MRAFDIHEDRVRFLSSLAVMAGYPTTLGSSLADGLRPDVIRVNQAQNGLFFGEAKNTERWSCAATQIRIRNYLRWFSVFLKHDLGTAFFAVCFGQHSESHFWAKTINKLSREEKVVWTRSGICNFGNGYSIAWFAINHDEIPHSQE